MLTKMYYISISQQCFCDHVDITDHAQQVPSNGQGKCPGSTTTIGFGLVGWRVGASRVCQVTKPFLSIPLTQSIRETY